MSDNKWLEEGSMNEKDERYMLGEDGDNPVQEEEAAEEDPVKTFILHYSPKSNAPFKA